ncbi:MAG: bifunctional sulfate adenylyltransferase/adenylylsulfate kinase [Pyrinomonadaceae bacterium]|nr:bifunctional sulfate adenylyltransferase/adenylylsulfate kinase [Pyrinomonadaceae bacterium]
MTRLITPYGGNLVDLSIATERADKFKQKASYLPRLQLSLRGIYDLEMLSTGGFSPIDRFMGQQDFESVLEVKRTSDGTLFPLPISLPLQKGFDIELDSEITLADRNNNLLAIMRVDEIYEVDRKREALSAYGTLDGRHPMVAEMNSWGNMNVSGGLRVISLPQRSDFTDFRLTPKETRNSLDELGYENVVAFQTRNPIHRVHEEMTKRAMEEIDGALLIHPVVGMTKPGDVDHFTRVRTYRALIEKYYDSSRTLLALLPLAMRMAGPREAILHAIIRRNYGANHLIVGRDHSGPGKDSSGNPFYGPFEAHEMLSEFSEEIGVKPILFKELAYLADEDRYGEKVNNEGKKTLSLSGTEVREEYLGKGKLIPAWFSRPEVAAILQKAHPPLDEQGFCIWFTGLSGSGKSTTAEKLISKLFEFGRSATLLDGDIVRTHLSKGLGFSKEDRDTNIRRIGFVASEIVRHGGAVICAAVSPYRATRNECRAMVGNDKFIEVFVDTPLDVCEDRDVKGMYELARAGKIKNFTGIDDPYEIPASAEITIETVVDSAAANADLILSYLLDRGFIAESHMVNKQNSAR